jgi:PIN domain nuclease of toxin-antitoxin system
VKLLLDTHIWIWSLLTPAKVASSVAAEMRNPTNELWLSPVSLWELVLLVEKNRLRLDENPVDWARKSMQELPVQEALLTHEIALATHSLSQPLRDPADRLLLATAKIMGLTLVTADDHLRRASDCKILSN